jgi:hypothetical protein
MESLVDSAAELVRFDSSITEGSALEVLTPCVICCKINDICKKKCAAPGAACESSCNCRSKPSRNCSMCNIPCIANQQRRTLKTEDLERDLPIESLDDPNAQPFSNEPPDSPIAEDPEHDIDIDIGVPANPINECNLAVIGCKSHCLHKGVCDNYCNCRYKNSYMCRGTKLTCDN